jgi:hypothetical protein
MNAVELKRAEKWIDEVPWPLADRLLQAYGVEDAAEIAAIRILVHADQSIRGVVHDLAPGWESRWAAVQDAADHFLAIGAQTFPAVMWSAPFAQALASRQPLHPVTRHGIGDGHLARIEAVLHETALHLPHGGPLALVEQLTHTLDLIRAGRAQVQITPMAAGLPLPPDHRDPRRPPGVNGGGRRLDRRPV